VALTPEAAQILLRKVKILKANPEAKIRIAGYASCSGTAEYNQKLSERRAQAVRTTLIRDEGIAPERITTIGYGATRPAEYEPFCELNESKAAHANMRVLFEVIVK